MPDLNQININITDTIPPENFATVDNNALVGSVYTKNQDNEWRKEVEATVQSGVKGVLKPNTPYDAVSNPYPTPWVAGNSPLYEKYDVNQAGPFPNTKDVNDENINVTQNELDLNEVQIWVKNGVSQKALKSMPQASVNIRKWEELQTNNFPLNEGYQVIYNNGYWMVDENKLATMTDLPGESDIWIEIGNGGVSFETKELGNKIFNDYYFLPSLQGCDYIGNNELVPFDSVLKKIEINYNAAGTVIISIGRINSNIYTQRTEINRSVVVGNNILEFNEKVKTGEIIWIKNPSISMGIDKTVQATQTIIYKDKNSSTVDTVNTSKLFFAITLKSEAVDGVKTIIDDELFSNRNSESSQFLTPSNFYTSQQLSNIKYIGNNIFFNSDKILTNVKVNVQNSGTLNLAIGIIDQNGYFVERKSLVKTAVSGINNFDVNETLFQGERVVSKFPHLNIGAKAIGAGSAGKEFYTNAIGGNVQYSNGGGQGGATDSISITVSDQSKMVEFVEEKLQPINNEINEIKNKNHHVLTSENGTKFILKVNNDGSLSTTSMLIQNILHIGNSFVFAGADNINWWGSWGMAASEKSKDYAHRFLAKVKLENPNASTDVINIADWERYPTTYDKNTLNPLLSGKDLVVIRVGENATYSSNYQAYFLALIEHVIAQNPTAYIIIGGVFWTDSQKDTAMQNVANSKGIPFVYLGDLNNSYNKSAVGNIVKGDDGLNHTITLQGVADHAGDIGMENIAQRLFSAL